LISKFPQDTQLDESEPNHRKHSDFSIMIDPEKPIEENLCRFFSIDESQLEFNGRTLIIHCQTQEEFTRLHEEYDFAQFWRGIYHYLALTLGDRLLVLPLREVRLFPCV